MRFFFVTTSNSLSPSLPLSYSHLFYLNLSHCDSLTLSISASLHPFCLSVSLSLSHYHSNSDSFSLCLSHRAPSGSVSGSGKGAALHRNDWPRAARESAPDRPRVYLRLPPLQGPDGELSNATPPGSSNCGKQMCPSSCVYTRCRRFALKCLPFALARLCLV